MSSYLDDTMFRLTVKPLLNVTFPDIVSTVEPDAPIYILVLYNVLISHWSSRGNFLWKVPQKDPGLAFMIAL